ncbi:MAG TPA: carboxypeptidase-like regulatory domain-containing protein [Thermoanaerobaculia bacterium]
MIKLRRLLSVALVATCFAVVPSEAAGKRRAVRHPTAPNAINAEISGTVIDNVTGQPVIGATVVAGEVSRKSDSQGKFTLKNVHGAGSVQVSASRTGYTTGGATITTSGDHNIVIRLNSLPTVTVKRTNNTTVNLDSDSVEFGYPDAFSGYRSSTNEDFCRADGTKLVVHREEVSRINGPATTAPASPCCPGASLERVSITLKTGGTQDLFFTDTCELTKSIDLIGRDHVTGKIIYIPFTQIAEVVFP